MVATIPEVSGNCSFSFDQKSHVELEHYLQFDDDGHVVVLRSEFREMRLKLLGLQLVVNENASQNILNSSVDSFLINPRMLNLAFNYPAWRKSNSQTNLHTLSNSSAEARLFGSITKHF